MKLIEAILGSRIFWYCLVAVCFSFLGYRLLDLKEENKRLGQNQEAILKRIQSIQLSNGRIAAQSAVLHLKLDELQKLYPQVIQEIKQLGVAKRQIVQYGQTAFASKLSIETALKDSFNQTSAAPKDSNKYKSFHYEDNYYSIEGVATQSKQWLRISNRDTLLQVVFRKRKTPWLWILSPYVYRQRIQCSNPNASIYYSQIIQLER